MAVPSTPTFSLCWSMHFLEPDGQNARLTSFPFQKPLGCNGRDMQPAAWALARVEVGLALTHAGWQEYRGQGPGRQSNSSSVSS